jgi:glycine C-acetyltransferase
MINDSFLKNLDKEISQLKIDGLYKSEYSIVSSQGAEVKIKIGDKIKNVTNLCANNYLGLAGSQKYAEVAKKAIDKYGFGTSSVRFICGTMDINREFETKVAEFLGYEDAISYSSCFAANNGIFQALFDKEDAIISAGLNHASLIDGIRLCKAKRFFYEFDDMADLESKIKESLPVSKNRIIITDGVFSMDGDIAKLKEICDLADKYGCMVMVDDSHATGFVGENGRGTAELCGVEGRVDIISSTLGKAIGGASGGFIASRKQIIDKLRNKSRPYLFSNNVIPAVSAVAIAIIEDLKNSKELIKKIADNAKYFRQKMTDAGFDLRAGSHPIIPVMFGNNEKIASDFAKDLIEEELIYAVAFSFPVVPKGEARIRVQVSAAHEIYHLDKAISAFIKVGKKYKIIK